ncbi:MAG: prepilin-type N-terminal cleavage/methylation domain-containing protein [Phycisphaeraceae bacterium]
MQTTRRKKDGGFSLIELVIVVVIIGIIGAIAIPRMSRGASGAADSALVANLSVLRNALDLYAAEHGGDYPTDETTIAEQLTGRTNAAGDVMPAAGDPADYIYGPYLRAVPPLPVGANKGETGFTDSEGESGSGWHYDAGEVKASTLPMEVDEGGTAYSEY